MSTTVKQFSYNQGTQSLPYTANGGSWAFTAGGGTGMTGDIDALGESANDSNSGTGALRATRSGRNRSDGTPYYEWTGTWEDLGVTPGDVVSDVNLDYDWRCAVYSTGAATSSYGPAALYDNTPTLIGTFSTSATFGGTSSFATKTGTSISGLSQASNTTIRLRIGAKPNTGSNTGASVQLEFDWVVVTITHAAGGGGGGFDVKKSSMLLVAP